MFVTILSWGTIVIVSIVGIFVMLLTRHMSMGTRLGTLAVATSIATVISYGAIHAAEVNDARKSGHITRWITWWDAVQKAHAELLAASNGDAAVEVPPLPDIRRFPRQVRRWLAAAAS